MKIDDTLSVDSSTFMNPEFLNSDEARGIRILSNFFHPERSLKTLIFKLQYFFLEIKGLNQKLSI